MLARLSKTAADEKHSSHAHAASGPTENFSENTDSPRFSSVNTGTSVLRTDLSKNLNGVTSSDLPMLGEGRGAFFTQSTSIASSRAHPGLGGAFFFALAFAFGLGPSSSLAMAHQLLASRTRGTQIEEPLSVYLIKQLSSGTEVSQVFQPDAAACQELITLKPILHTKTRWSTTGASFPNFTLTSTSLVHSMGVSLALIRTGRGPECSLTTS